MPDQAAGGWAALNDVEIVNSQRTTDYIKNFGLPVSISQGCWCTSIKDLLDCPPASGTTETEGYEYPSTDPAPWYSDGIPESGDFLGFLPIEFEGLGSTYTREVTPTINGGGVLGRLRAEPRTLTWRGLLFGRTCCAAEYGLRWLTSRLAAASGCAGCTGAQLDMLYCCVDVDVNESECAAGDAPPINPQMFSDAFRSFYKVGLVEGPRKLSDRVLGCTGCTQKRVSSEGRCAGCTGVDGIPCPGGACMIEVEFSLVAGNPYMFRDPVTVCEKKFIDAPCTDCDDPNLDQWKYVAPGEKCRNPLDCGQFANSSCLIDPDNPDCNPDDLPVIPEFTDPCGGCDPIDERVVCCNIDDSVYGEFFDGVLSVEIYSGDQVLRNVSINVFENPQERDCDDPVAIDRCHKCDSLKVRYVPKFSTLRIDGVNRRVELECPGSNIQPAEALTTSPFSFPVLNCNPYIITATTDCAFPVSEDATIRFIITPREN